MCSGKYYYYPHRGAGGRTIKISNLKQIVPVAQLVNSETGQVFFFFFSAQPLASVLAVIATNTFLSKRTQVPTSN